MRAYQIQPNDVLFFRDARPMEVGVGSGGHGANWPQPSIWFAAIHAALYRAFPDKQEWEHTHRTGCNGKYDDPDRKQRHGALKTAGFFPVRAGMWYFPTPADLMNEAGTVLRPMVADAGRSNLPRSLKYAAANPAEPAKEKPARAWRSRAAIEAYLRGRPGGESADSADLYEGEWVTGIGMDPERQTQDGERIYSAEYLRLKPGVALGGLATLPLKERNQEEGLDRLLDDGAILIVGGQQRACGVQRLADQRLEDYLPVAPEPASARVKWTLLTPAVFPRLETVTPKHPGGWLPTWINPEDGRVMLTAGPGLKKAQRIHAQAGRPINARLVAAVVPRAVPISGWTSFHPAGGAGGINPTLLAVPAGAVYYFEADSVDEARALAAALNWHGAQAAGIAAVVNRRSSLLGEKGFGLGVCGTWKTWSDR